MVLTPFVRIASNTLKVAIVFWSRSLRGCSMPKRTSAFADRWNTISAPRTFSLRHVASRTSASMNSNFELLSALAMNSRRPVARLSYPTTVCPCSRSLSTRVLPMNPAAPVTKARMISWQSVIERSGLLDFNVNEFTHRRPHHPEQRTGKRGDKYDHSECHRQSNRLSTAYRSHPANGQNNDRLAPSPSLIEDR